MKLFDQDLCNNLWYELNPRVRCAFGNVFISSFTPTPTLEVGGSEKNRQQKVVGDW